MKKIEIIERITDANGSISENILTSWEHKNQFIPEIIRFGELKIYLQERIVKKNDSDVHLSKYEYDILLFLAKSPGRIFGKEMVYDLVWNEPYSGDYNVVMRHICNIREKIEDDPGQPLYIQTVRGVGYRFNGNLAASEIAAYYYGFTKKEVCYGKIFLFQDHPVLDTWTSFDVSIPTLSFLSERKHIEYLLTSFWK